LPEPTDRIVATSPECFPPLGAGRLRCSLHRGGERLLDYGLDVLDAPPEECQLVAGVE